MKVIDLLNKIANGEEVPKKIKFEDIEYKWNKKYYIDEKYYSLGRRYCLDGFLNDEVEIIEENKKIEKIGNDYYHEKQDRINEIFQRKINEIIEVLNKE